MKVIRIIAENVSTYAQVFYSNENLICSILKHQLSLFAGEKDFWLADLLPVFYHLPDSKKDEISVNDIDCITLLTDYLNREKEFLSKSEGIFLSPIKELSFASYLSSFTLWLMEHRTDIPKDILCQDTQVNLHGQLIDSSFLNTYAYNMTARTYVTNPAIEREQEIRDLELILISPKKSPILIGEAGVGKTSVVEGFAYLLQRNQVPDLLKNKKIFKLTTTSLLSGTKYVGEMEERIKKLMDELDKHPEVILFIDEIHTIVGAGSTESSNNDISNMLKPYIDRGDIKIIGSTTSQEYVDYLIPDKALARRFYPITVEEPDEAMALRILAGTIPAIEYETKVKNPFTEEEIKSILRILIQLSRRENQPKDRRTRLPELPLTLLEMAFSYAALDSRKYLTKDDIILSIQHTNLLKKDIRVQAEQYFFSPF